MRESDLTATMTVHYASDGEGAVVAGLKAVGAEQDRVSASAQALATATDSAARRQVSAAAAFDALARRMDPAARAFADLERNQNAYNRALAANSSIVDKAGQGLDVYKAKLEAQKLAAEGVLRAQEDLRRQQSNLTTITTPVAASSSPTQTTAPPPSATPPPNNLFEAEQLRLAERLTVFKAALDAGRISQAAFDAEQERGKQNLVDYGNWLNKTTRSVESLNYLQSKLSTNATPQEPSKNPTQITGAQLSNVNTREYAAQAEAAAKAQDDMIVSSNRLLATLNPLEAEQGRLGKETAALNSALAAGRIGVADYAAEQERLSGVLAASIAKIQATEVATENLRRQQSNLTTNTTVTAPTNPIAPPPPPPPPPSNNLFEAEQGRLAERLSFYKAALDAGSISQRAFDAEHVKAGQILKDYGDWLNKTTRSVESLNNLTAKVSTPLEPSKNPTQITGAQLSNVNTREYAAQFEAATRAQDDMVASATRLKAALDPVAAEQARITAEGKSYKEMLDAQVISQAQFTAAMEKTTAAEIANENVRRQQANASDTSLANRTVSVSPNMPVLPSTPVNNAFEAEQGRLAERIIAYKAALDAGTISQRAFDAEQEKGKQTLVDYGNWLNTTTRSVESLNNLTAKVSTPLEPSKNPTQITGTQLSNVNTREYAAQFEAAAKAQDDMAAASNRLKAALNPLAAEEAKQVQELGLLKQAQQAGIITAEQFASAQQLSVTRLANLSQSLKSAGTAGRVMSGEMTNLGFQLNDVVTGLALGQSLPMIIGQQGGQIIQIFANSKSSIADFASSSMTWFTSLFTVGRVAFGGIATAVGAAAYAMNAFATSQREAGQALIGVGQRTGTTIGQINAFAKDNASATGLSVDQARTVAVEFTKTGNIAVNGLKGVGDAIHGFSILTGQDATEATKFFAKALSGDAVAAAQEFNKTYGFLSSSTMEYIRNLELSGDHTKAVQVIIDAMAKDNIKAADSVGILSKAWSAFGNVASGVKNAIGSIGAPASLQDQLKEAEAKRDTIQNSPSPLGSNPGGFGLLNTGALAGGGAEFKAAALAEVGRVIDDLNEKLKLDNADTAVKKLNQISAAGDEVVKSTIPQIDQIQKLQLELKKLQEARDTPGVDRNLGQGQDDAAIIAKQNLIAKTQELQAETERYNQRVQEISGSWGNVGQSTALALQALQNQLPAAQAITAAAQMTAQYYATINTLLDQGKTATEAQALAAKQYELSVAAASSAVMKQVESLKDANAMIKAQQNGTEGSTAAAIAYKNAINSGADEASALALKIETAHGYTLRAAAAALEWQQNLLGVGAAAQQAAASIEAAALATDSRLAAEARAAAPNAGTFNPDIMSANGGSYANSAGHYTSIYYRNGGAGKRLSPGGFADPNAQTYLTEADVAAKFGVPVTGLTSSIDKLTSSTNNLNSTMGDLLSPYYSMDPRTSHIGYRSQGMSPQSSEPDWNAVATQGAAQQTAPTSATAQPSTAAQVAPSTWPKLVLPGMASGGEFTVPGGYSANDNMIGHIPLASGEIVSVRRPGESGGGGTTQTINITNHIVVGDRADKNEIGRTVYQATQNATRQTRAASI